MTPEKYNDLVEQAAQAIIDERPEGTEEARDVLLARFFGSEITQQIRTDVSVAHMKKEMASGKF